MAKLNDTFDASQVDPAKPNEPLPPGDYPVQIIQSEMRVTKAGTGQYLWLEMEILDGEAKGRKLWDRLNLVNASDQARQIAERTLSAICHATGVMSDTRYTDCSLYTFPSNCHSNEIVKPERFLNTMRCLPWYS